MGRVASSFLVVTMALRAAGAIAQEPAGKPAPSFTDDDLARYREERLREEEDAGALTTAPAPAEAVAAPSVAPPEAPRARASVVLKDLNGTLPREYREKAENAARSLAWFFGVPAEESVVIPLRYFPDREAYLEYRGRNIAGNVMWTGYYDPLKGEIVVGGGPEALAILVHEVNHFVVDRVFEDAPVWFDEGLAEYFEGVEVVTGGLSPSDKPHHRRRLAAWLQEGGKPTLRQLLAPGGWTSVAPGFEHERLVRAISWSVVEFMMGPGEGRQILHSFMDRLEQERGLHSLVVLERTYPGGVAAFERQWLEHVAMSTRAP